ncbi:bacteriocin immunity protein [Vibrio parahaemolyticus]|nr:bacteriocin immunity protein [Vibrio parahaemolyticus]
MIFHPAASREDSVDGVIEELKSWYKQQGKGCFKDE